MDQNINTSAPMPEEKKSTGAVVSIIVIVLILTAGAYYFSRQVTAPRDETNLYPTSTTTLGTQMNEDQTISAFSTQSASTNLDDIQKDLDATNFSGIDAGLSDITL